LNGGGGGSSVVIAAAVSQSYQTFDKDRYPISLTVSRWDRDFSQPVSQSFDIIGTSSVATNLYFPNTGSAIFGTTTTSNSRWLNNLPTESLDSWVAVFKIAANFNEYSDGVIGGNPALGVVISSGSANDSSNVNNSEAISLGYINSAFKIEIWRMTGGFNYASTPYTDNVMGDRKWFTDWIYVRVKKHGPNITYAIGYNGETYETFASHSVATHTGTPTMLGVWRSSAGTKPEFMNVAWMRFATGSETRLNGDFVNIPSAGIVPSVVKKISIAQDYVNTTTTILTASYAQTGPVLYQRYDPFCPPLNPSNLNDEFTIDSSGSVPANWIAGGAATASYQVKNGSLIVAAPAAGATFHATVLEKPLPTGSFTIATHMIQLNNIQYGIGGLHLRSTVSGKRAVLGMYFLNGAAGQWYLHYQKYSSFTVRDGLTDSLFYNNNIFIRYSYDETTLRGEYSFDGKNWIVYFSEAMASYFSGGNLPDRFGISMDSYSATELGKASFEFVRYFPTGSADIGRNINVIGY
jgi:hypothetical protein